MLFFFVSKNRPMNNKSPLIFVALATKNSNLNCLPPSLGFLVWAAMIPPNCSAPVITTVSGKPGAHGIPPQAVGHKKSITANERNQWRLEHDPRKKGWQRSMKEKSPWTSLTSSGSSGCSIGQVTELVEARGLGAIFWGISKRYSCSSSTCEINWNVI